MPAISPAAASAGRPVMSRLLPALLIAALLMAAVVAWLALQGAADKHRHGAKNVGAAAPAPISKDNRPAKFTASFIPAALPLTEPATPVYLYVSPTTARYLRSVGGNYDAFLIPWRNLLAQRNRPYVEISSLGAVPAATGSVLILPSALALNQAERRQIAEFQRQGGNLLATWSLGVHGEDDSWKGHAFLEQLFGVKVLGEVAATSMERFLNLYGDSPLTAGYPAGRRLWLESTTEPMLRLTGGETAGVYLDWMRNAGSDAARGAVVFDEHGDERRRARWVMLGFAETSWGTATPLLSGLIENALHWLSHGVNVTKPAWPVPYRAAYILEMDTEEAFGNARNFVSMMDAAGLRGTFYCLTSEAVRFPYLMREIGRRHEIAFHGDVHTGFAGQPESLQSRRLDRMRADMERVMGTLSNKVGFRAPLEQYDKTTERLLHDKGFRHHAADPNRTDARLPFFSEAGSALPERALVVLPRTQHDDTSLRAGERYPGAEQDLLRSLLSDLKMAVEMRGLGLLSIHSQYFGRGSLLHDVMPDFLDQVRRYGDQLWTAPANEIADWWRERERLQYEVRGSSDQFLLEVTISGDGPLARGAVVVSHKAGGVGPSLQAVSTSEALPLLKPLDAFRTAIVFDGMRPGSYSYVIKPARASPTRGSL